MRRRNVRGWAALVATCLALVLPGACGSTTGRSGGEAGAEVDAGSPSAAGADDSAGTTSGGARAGSAGATSSPGGRTSQGGADGEGGADDDGATGELAGGAGESAGAAGDGGAPPASGCLLGYPGPPLTTIDGLPRVVASGDMNDDGRMDLVVGNWINLGDRLISSLTVLPGQGNGTFSTPIDYDLGSFAASAIALADFNGDRQLDVAIAGSNGKVDGLGLLVFLGAGGGTLAPPTAHVVGDTPTGLVATDLDADGHTDLAVASFYSTDVTVLLNTGDGTFGSGESTRTGILAMGLVAADFDGDGWTDLAVAEARFFFNVLTNQGHGVFVDDVGAIGTGAGVEQAHSLVAADFDHDGRPDLAIGYEGDS